jgi:NAD(P)-dependent dehydrogenase (short-subunit alcohol dehydrogenase family)
VPEALVGRVALVTGAGSGIGRAAALAFAEASAQVVVSDIDVAAGEETVARIRGSGGDATFVRADVSVAQEAAALIRAAVSIYGRLDCAHNNAGIVGALALPHEYPEDAWDRTIAINLTGVWLCLKYEVEHMLAHRGAIVNTSSVMGMVAGPTNVGYAASKHGVIGVTRSAALAYAQSGIRVNAVCPGYIRTGMTEGLLVERPEAEQVWLSNQPIGRLGAPEEVAQLVVWLCTDAASFVTGAALPVDGAYLAR